MFYKRLSVIAGFAALLIVLAVNMVVLRRQLDKQAEEQARLSHARQVLFELERTESLLKDAESGQRGFLYANDLRYLEPYNRAIDQLGSHLDNLTRLAKGSPRLEQEASALHDLAQAKLTEMAQTLSLYRSGKPDAARTVVTSGAGLVTMNRIRAIVDRMEAEEGALEAARTGAYEQSVRLTFNAIYLASFLAATGLILLAYFILREIHQRERYLHELRRREEWYRVTLTSIGDAVIATNASGQVTFLNPAAELLTGTNLAQDKGKDVLQVFPIFNELTHQPAEDPVSKVIALGRVVGLANHTVLKRSDGTLVPIEDSAAPIRDDRGHLLGVVLVFRDVTTDRKSQEILRKTEKLASAARLSATVAHEINNPLEAVVNLIFIAKNTPGALPEIIQHLTTAEQELERVAHITHQTLGFYRETNVQEQIEMRALIESVFKLYSNKLGAKNITIACNLAACPTVTGVPGELKQVISNLIANAADAVGANGTITIGLQRTGTMGGDAVELLVEDDGPGVPAGNRDRIFEPFFTTKKDVGTGLGLWLTREIVERHGGSIRLDLRENGSRGAAFRIILPSSPQVERDGVAVRQVTH